MKVIRSLYLHLSWLILMIFASIQVPALAAYDYGDPTAQEQEHLELINRARATPKAEAARLSMAGVTEGVSDEDISKYMTEA